jgi:hypothetical protein
MGHTALWVGSAKNIKALKTLFEPLHEVAAANRREEEHPGSALYLRCHSAVYNL